VPRRRFQKGRVYQRGTRWAGSYREYEINPETGKRPRRTITFDESVTSRREAEKLLEAGTPIHVVTRLMRHGDSKVTLDHYAHIISGAERRASEQLSNRIGAQLESEQLESGNEARTA